MNYEQKTICFARMSAIFCVHTHISLITISFSILYTKHVCGFTIYIYTFRRKHDCRQMFCIINVMRSFNCFYRQFQFECVYGWASCFSLHTDHMISASHFIIMCAQSTHKFSICFCIVDDAKFIQPNVIRVIYRKKKKQ